MQFRPEQDIVCHPSMFDTCKIQRYCGDGNVEIYSATALWGKKYISTVPAVELRLATKDEADRGLNLQAV